jgi:peptidyl-prolyl cis-trans isomerase D
MFDFVRKHTKIMMGLMFLLIIPSFVLFGIDGYNRFREGGDVVATVGDESISRAEWDANHKTEVDRLRAAMPNIDPKLLDSPSARYVTLERMVRERALAQASKDARLTTSDARLARDLQDNPAIASLRKPDGSLDMDRYRQLLGAQGMSPEMYEARLRNDIAVRQVELGITQTALVANTSADEALKAFFERREIQVANFKAQDFAAQVKPSDADIEAYYKANTTQFQAAEQAAVEYVVLDINAVRKSITLSEADVKSYYEQNAARLSGQEERRASHILITAAKTSSQEERDKAMSKAKELLQIVKQKPESFAEVARKNSQDPGSASNGGDLDFFARGAMVKPFEEAAFALKKGEISDVVTSDFGFHIIKVTDIKTPKQKSFDELRASLEDELKNQQARAKFAEAAELFTNLVYEQSDSLKPVAQKLKLEIQTANNISRVPAQGVSGALANPKLLAALFSPESVEQKRNTEAVEVGTSMLAAARISQYTAPRTLALDEVRPAVQYRLVAARSAELAKQAGADKLAAWQAKPESASLASPVTVSRNQSANVSPAVVDKALRADPAKLPLLMGVDLGEQGYAVVRVAKVVPRETLENVKKQERAQYAQTWNQAESQAYGKLLQQRFKTSIKEAQPGL